MQPNLEIVIITDHPKQKSQHCVTLRLRHSHDPPRESRIDIDGFPTSHRVNADDRVNGFNFLPADVCAGGAGALSLSDRGVESGEGFEVGLEGGGQGGVEGITGEGILVRRNWQVKESTHPELHKVSPPYSGPVMTLREVTPGGWASYDTYMKKSSQQKLAHNQKNLYSHPCAKAPNL
jgi:hypothetical protein